LHGATSADGVRGFGSCAVSKVREDGDWEAWTCFFLEGVAETANAAVDSAHRLLALVKRDQDRMASLGTSGTGLARIYASLRAHPVANMSDLATAPV
jgi:hypothetical protein